MSTMTFDQWWDWEQAECKSREQVARWAWDESRRYIAQPAQAAPVSRCEDCSEPTGQTAVCSTCAGLRCESVLKAAQAVDVEAGSAHKDEDPAKLARAVCEAVIKHQFQDKSRHGRLTLDVQTFLRELNAARDSGLTRAISGEKAGRVDGWISVKERLPERNKPAIYWHKSDFGGFAAIADEWCDEHHLAQATHWMPYVAPASPAPDKEG